MSNLDKKKKIIISALVIIFSALIISISFVYFFAVPRSSCCAHFVYTSYYLPNNSTNHFSINLLNVGLVEITIANLTAIRFTNTSDTFYPIKAFGNGTEISFPLVISQNMEINLTLELDWHFTVGSQYTFYLDYNYGKSISFIFIANKQTYTSY